MLQAEEEKREINQELALEIKRIYRQGVKW